MTDFSKLLFLPLDMPAPPSIVDVLDTVAPSEYTEDTYRISPCILLTTRDGEWLPVADEMSEFKEWAQTHLFNWATPSQMVVIVTPPGKKMAPHIDCSPEMFPTWQHKFRCVLQGESDTLYYFAKDKKTRKDIQVPAPSGITSPYMISGRWPHAMHNTSDKAKYTLCMGAPWEPGPNNEDYMAMLNKSAAAAPIESYLTTDGLELPSKWWRLFNSERYGKIIKKNAPKLK